MTTPQDSFFQPFTCPAPPYNSPKNVNYATNAQRAPNFPFNSGSNQSQLTGNAAANSIYANVNLENEQIAASGSTVPYKLFKSDHERIAYLQGQIAAQTRAIAISSSPIPPAFPTPTAQQLCTNVFAIINKIR